VGGSGWVGGCSETSAYHVLTPGKSSKEHIQFSNHGESLKSTYLSCSWRIRRVSCSLILKIIRSLHLFLGRPLFLSPFGLYCNACCVIPFVSILDQRFFSIFYTQIFWDVVRLVLSVSKLHIRRSLQVLLTLRRLMSYIYGAPILDVSRSHTTTQHSR